MAYLACVKEIENSSQATIFGSEMPTFGQFTEFVYWPTCQRLKHTTRDLYFGYLEKYIMPLFRDAPLDEITHADIQWLIAHCPSESTGRGCRDAMSSVLGCAYKNYRIIKENPALGHFVYQEKVDGTERQGTVLQSFEQIKEFMFAVMDDRPDADVARAIAVGLLFGLRPSEDLGLDSVDIDFENDRLCIANAYTVGRHSPSLEGPKTENSGRVLPIYPFAKKILLSFTPVDGPWIQNKLHRRSSPRVVGKKLLRLRNRCGLPNVTLESSRHSFATCALKSGMSVADLAAWLEHKDPSVTVAHYCRTNFESLQMASSTVDNAFCGTPPIDLEAEQKERARIFLENLSQCMENAFGKAA